MLEIGNDRLFWREFLSSVQNRYMPKISAPTVAEHREARREALLAAAANLMQQGKVFTVAQVAQEVGLSRSAVYEYYNSAADLIADVLVDEMAAWIDEITPAVEASLDPRTRMETWVRGVLNYVAEGRHALLRSAASVELPEVRREQVQTMHRELVAPLAQALSDLGINDARQLAAYVWGILDAAINRIESQGFDAKAEAGAVIDFINSGICR